MSRWSLDSRPAHNFTRRWKNPPSAGRREAPEEEGHRIPGLMGSRSGSRATAAITAHPESRVTVPPSSLLPVSVLYTSSQLLPCCLLCLLPPSMLARLPVSKISKWTAPECEEKAMQIPSSSRGARMEQRRAMEVRRARENAGGARRGRGRDEQRTRERRMSASKTERARRVAEERARLARSQGTCTHPSDNPSAEFTSNAAHEPIKQHQHGTEVRARCAKDELTSLDRSTEFEQGVHSLIRRLHRVLQRRRGPSPRPRATEISSEISSATSQPASATYPVAVRCVHSVLTCVVARAG